MIDRSAIVAEARSWVDTPVHPQARLKGIGVDCAGLILGVAKACGCRDYDSAAFRLKVGAKNGFMAKTLTAICGRSVNTPLPGDIVILQIGDLEHLGILMGETIVHVDGKLGVVEHGIDNAWRKRMRSSFRFPGVK